VYLYELITTSLPKISHHLPFYLENSISEVTKYEKTCIEQLTKWQPRKYSSKCNSTIGHEIVVPCTDWSKDSTSHPVGFLTNCCVSVVIFLVTITITFYSCIYVYIYNFYSLKNGGSYKIFKPRFKFIPVR